MTLFKITYYVGKELLTFNKFLILCILLLSVFFTITTKIYQDDKACADMLVYIFVVIKRIIFDRVRYIRFVWHHGGKINQYFWFWDIWSCLLFFLGHCFNMYFLGVFYIFHKIKKCYYYIWIDTNLLELVGFEFG